jgi:preprotein translocase subunit SecA
LTWHTSVQRLGNRVSEFVHRIRNGIAISNARYQKLADLVSASGPAYAKLSDQDLRLRVKSIRDGVRSGDASLDDVSVETFSIAREAAQRTLAMRPYDVQVLAAFAMHDCKCIEMQTGEGKTLAAALTVCLRAMTGRGVHVLTFNDYLASRDASWMRPLYEFFELSVGHVKQGMSGQERRAAYASDVTYVTARESGFDFLRDHGCIDPSERVQRGFHFAIVDEADSILIDEARIPLVIAAEDKLDEAHLYDFAHRISALRPHGDYEIKGNRRTASFTDAGLSRLESQIGCGELHTETNIELLTRLNVALHAEVLLTRDIDYIVRNGAIELIDEFTGRVAQHRRWPGGINAALEAKEELTIQPQGRILNSITLQHFLDLYESLTGMSGTTREAATELYEFYDLKVVVIPPNRPCIRNDHSDRLFTTKRVKMRALVEEIAGVHQLPRPIRVGTARVSESEGLADLLRNHDISCRILNAANDNQEAEIIAEAGALGAVTISTNMAGRGTDIRLGGSDERERTAVTQLGGLYVIGTNRHESRRIDNQLRGRAGRQGDPGESRFFISLEDDLIGRFGARDLIRDCAVDDVSCIDDPEVARRIAHLQRVIEGQSFEIRHTLHKYATLLETQRQQLHVRYDRLLRGETSPATTREQAPEFYRELIDRWGEPLIVDVERVVELRHIERCWSEHLAHAAEIRDNIHLVSMGGFNAFDEFNRQMNIAFRSLKEQIESSTIETMRTARITAAGIDLQNEGLNRPSSTWTFMINDNPKGSVLDQLTKGIARMVKGSKRGNGA